MDYTSLLVLLIAVVVVGVRAQHENIPYENVDRICETCMCLSAQDADKRFHYTLNCATKNFKHILARWPEEFGKNHNDIDIVATFSSNSIEVLQQLPATNASLTFSCRHCAIKHLQAPTFMDVPNIRRLDLSWNQLTADELTPDVFRGPYHATAYEPIALIGLDLSHNELQSLDKKLFEHTPNITILNLSYNPFKVLDNSVLAALASATSLKELDLSHTSIKTVPPAFFKTLINLQSLQLAGNQFTTLPASLQLLGRSLRTLDLSGNPLSYLDEQSFLGLKVVQRLNISDMPTLRSVDNGTFARLETLEYLHCAHNPRLAAFDLDSLLHCSNLTQLDLSYCALTTLSLNMDLSVFSRWNETNITTTGNGTLTLTTSPLPTPWPKLRVFETVGNPWLCDCGLLQTLEYVGAHHRYKDIETRCESPYLLAGARLSNITAQQVCAMHLAKQFHVVEEDPPRFLRKDYIIMTAIIASVVIVLGLGIGFLVVCIRRRLKHDDFGTEPIRYTSVRSSNLSAFANVNTIGNGNGNGINNSNGISSSNNNNA